MPIRLRLALLFAAGAALVVFATSITFVHFLDNQLRSSIDASLRVRESALEPVVAKPANPIVLPNQPNGVAQVYDDAGNVVVAAGTSASPLLQPPALARARRGETLVSETLSDEVSNRGGDHTRLLATPMPRNGKTWVIVVGTSLEPADTAVERVRHAALLGGPIAVALAAIAAWLLATAALRPVERMRGQVAGMSPGDPETLLTVPKTRDEVAALAATMNGLLVRLRNTIGRERAFVADAAHELRTPLAILRAELELAARPGRSKAELLDAVSAAGEETDRLSRLAEDLLFLARVEEGAAQLHREPTELRPLLTAAASRATNGAAANIEVDADPALVAEIDPDRMRQAVSNLIENAVRHSQTGDAVTVSGRSEGDTLVIQVADHGPGFPPDFLPHAFERFRRAGSSRSRDYGGAGLGLAIVRSVAAAHGGSASAENRASGGAVVAVRVPAAVTRLPQDASVSE
jgi:heavy metal sensor kinase